MYAPDRRRGEGSRPGGGSRGGERKCERGQGELGAVRQSHQVDSH